MCGIFCEIVQSPGPGCALQSAWPELRDLLINRGPDRFTESLLVRKVCERPPQKICFGSSVLWLRGKNLVEQPREEDGNVLLWNGDVFGGDLEVPEHFSDTEVISKAMSRLPDEEVPHFFSKILGPFAFVYFRESSKTIWFGRDYFGRHSLLMRRNNCEKGFLLASVTRSSLPCVELPASGVYKIHLEEFYADKTAMLYPWSNIEATNLDLPFLTVKLAHPIQSPVVLPSISLKDCSSRVDYEWLKVALSEKWSVQTVLSKFAELDPNGNIEKLQSVLRKSVRTRVEKQPQYCKLCIKTVLKNHDKNLTCSHAKIGVLFSGGLDSVVISALVDQILEASEPVDLLNVSFQQSDGSFEVPDRLTALQALKELKRMSPERKFRLVEVNVTKEELGKAREDRIRDLLHPLETVLDDSIGCAIWFAARGAGIDGMNSTARVLLLGMGADEQLGGYSRHRVKFNEGGVEMLTEELLVEVSRISHRNLGRDNRIVADHGVAPRYPYLDEDVVNFLSSLSTEEKMDLRFPRGLGEKLLLRALAFKLGLEKTALEPKRAIQFGSRIAKMENKKEKGADVALRVVVQNPLA